MARYRQLPMGLPPHLANRIARVGAGSTLGYDPGLGALGFSFKKLVKSVAKVATKAGQIAIAPMKLGIEAPLKAVTWAGAQTGIKPLVKLDKAVRSDLKVTIQDAKTSAIIGATIGAGIVTGGTALPAMIPTVMGAADTLLKASMPKAPAPGPVQDSPFPSALMAEAQVKQSQVPSVDVNAVTGQPTGPTGVPLATQQAHQTPGQASGGINPLYLVAGVGAVGLLALMLVPRRSAAPAPPPSSGTAGLRRRRRRRR